MRVRSWIWNVMIPIAGMITVEFTDVGVSTLSKAALANGMSRFVSVLYYNSLASLFLLPFFIFFRKKRGPISFSLLCRFFLIALIGSTGQILFLTGIKLSSPTLSSAMANVVPIITFLLAVVTRMESVDIRKSSSQAKTAGAIVTVTGAFIVTLYKGPTIFTTTPSTFGSYHHHHFLLSSQSDWMFGGLLLALTCLMSAIWNIVQGATVKEYPEEMTIVFFFTFFTTIQSAAFALIFETNPNAWKLKTIVEIIAIVYTAVFGSLFRIGIHTWCLGKKGPVFVAMFKPLGIVVAVAITVVFLGDTLHLGSVIGSIIIAFGFYSFIWGQIKENSNAALDSEASSLETSCKKTPLLQSNANEEV